MKHPIIGLWALLLALVLAACGDLPTTPSSPELAGAGPRLSGECTLRSDGTFVCPPESPDWGDGCEWYQDCDGDCMSSSGATDPAEGAPFRAAQVGEGVAALEVRIPRDREAEAGEMTAVEETGAAAGSIVPTTVAHHPMTIRRAIPESIRIASCR